jgi:glycosyltransferase 2 family protein
VVSFAIAAILLYLSFRGVDWAAFWNILRFGNYQFLLITIPIATVNYFIRAARWRIFIQSQGKVPLLPVFWANMVGYMGNAYLPARAGELLRSGFLGRRTGLGMSFVLATALTERLLDVIALVIIGSAALLAQPNLSPLIGSSLWAIALAGVLGLVIAVAAPSQEDLILRVLARIPLSRRVSGVVAQQISRFLLGMRSLRSGKRLFLFALLTLVIWLVDAVANTIGVHVISQTLTITQALVLLAGLGLSSAIPSTPGYVGVYQFIAVTVLIPFGFTRAQALAYILIGQITSFMLVTVFGLIGLWQVNKAT